MIRPPWRLARDRVGAAADGFQRVGWGALGLLFLLTCLTFVVDLVSTALGAKRAGASRLALLGAFVGSLIGLAFGIPGLLVGPFLGAIAGDHHRVKRLWQANVQLIRAFLGTRRSSPKADHPSDSKEERKQKR